MSPAQNKVIAHILEGGLLEATFSGLKIYRPGRTQRALHPVTERVVRDHFGSRLRWVNCQSERHKIPRTFVCLVGREKNIPDGYSVRPY